MYNPLTTRKHNDPVICVAVPVSYQGVQYPGIAIEKGVTIQPLAGAPCDDSRKVIQLGNANPPVAPFYDGVTNIEGGNPRDTTFYSPRAYLVISPIA